MITYEKLLDEASSETVEVFEKDLKKTIKGLYADNIIWLNKNQTSTEKNCTLAEELGHYYTSSGNILDQNILENRKQEKRARNWAYKKLIPLIKIVQAHKAGIRNKSELADFLEVTEEFLEDALHRYKEEYGLYAKIDGLSICFEPLGVLEWFER